MLKQILTFSLAFLLCACMGGIQKSHWADRGIYQHVDFFAAGQTQAAFKAVGTMNGMGLEGVLIMKKIGEDDYEVSVLAGGAYRVMQAQVTPQGIAYRYLFKEADTPLVRGRISQFLSLLLLAPGDYQRHSQKNDELTVVYKNDTATVRLFYTLPEVFPVKAQTATLLNTAEMFYGQYAPADEAGSTWVPHELMYKDGKIELALELIRLQ